MNKCLVKFIGMLSLVFTVGMCAIKPDTRSFAPLAIGSALMLMVYAGGYYSPEVTIAVWLRGKCFGADLPGYIASQVLENAGTVASRFLLTKTIRLERTEHRVAARSCCRLGI